MPTGMPVVPPSQPIQPTEAQIRAHASLAQQANANLQPQPQPPTQPQPQQQPPADPMIAFKKILVDAIKSGDKPSVALFKIFDGNPSWPLFQIMVQSMTPFWDTLLTKQGFEWLSKPENLFDFLDYLRKCGASAPPQQ